MAPVSNGVTHRDDISFFGRAGFVELDLRIAGILQGLINIRLILFGCDARLDGPDNNLPNIKRLVKGMLDAFWYFFFAVFQHVRHTFHVGVIVHKPNAPVEHQEITALNNAIQNGAQLHEARELAGHADIRTTELYFVRKEEDAERAARRIAIR